ncbi:hypothetical protein ATE84_2879 [Aquimarina sp. MAR_2010_214]|uniref:hypothetical protein n=1 Tax=Aquimarina sp. MAR_2010_214 TaxID=1250026 RepID=UPI000C70E31E|nr:hypothetical protein [Aquimarina sp. MAR_2010_214]PKV50812.1 hypothetical protein ATE84_2879 [Aquimarina sp. MAR_2010_214]
MANAKTNLYIANLKPANEERFGFSILKGSICVEDLKELLESEEVKNLIYEYEGSSFINIKVIERKNPDNYGRSHFVAVDDFVPDSKKRKVANDSSKAANDNEAKDTTEKTKTEEKSTTGKTGKRGSKKQATKA